MIYIDQMNAAYDYDRKNKIQVGLTDMKIEMPITFLFSE